MVLIICLIRKLKNWKLQKRSLTHALQYSCMIKSILDKIQVPHYNTPLQIYVVCLSCTKLSNASFSCSENLSLLKPRSLDNTILVRVDLLSIMVHKPNNGYKINIIVTVHCIIQVVFIKK